MTQIFLVQEIDNGSPQEPTVFHDEIKAGEHFQKIVTAKNIRFRSKVESESWQQYRDSFSDYYHSKSFPFDTIDWEIHWFAPTTKDDALTINLSLPVVTDPFNEIEIHPCRVIDHSTEQCEPDEAHFWSLYLHLVEGGLNCIADFSTRTQAESFAFFLRTFQKFNRLS